MFKYKVPGKVEMRQGTPPTPPGLSNKSDVGSMKKSRKMTTEKLENTMKQLYEKFSA